jgi:hypothetical protein
MSGDTFSSLMDRFTSFPPFSSCFLEAGKFKDGTSETLEIHSKV